MYKKLIALCLSVALAVSTAITPIFADNPNKVIKKDSGEDIFSAEVIEKLLRNFKDSKDIKWAEKSIEKMGALHILDGFGNGFFKPKNNVTHAEAIAMVLKLTGKKAEAEAIKKQPEFFKGKCDKWSYGYLQLALDEGIIIPEEDGKFNPKTPAKRHEIAKYIVRAIGKKDMALQNMNQALNYYDSAAIPKNSRGYVYVITSLGIMQGDKNVFQPNKPITRAEMAVILDRAEDTFDDIIENDNAMEGIFVSYDKANSLLTMNIKNKQVSYKVNPNAPVYKDSTYYTLDALKAGDVIEIVVDSSNKIIFIEYKKAGTTTAQLLNIQQEQYDNLPIAMKSKIDSLKLTKSYAAFKYEQYIYLVAARGEMNTGGYSIKINEVYKESTQTDKYSLKAIVEEQNPSGNFVVQAITYPYDIVKLSYFDGIEKVNFVGKDNNLLIQTVLTALDNTEVINGKISAVDTTNNILYVKDANNVITPYLIPTNAQITLNNITVTLSALSENMTVAITRTNNLITKVAAAQAVQTINGKIDSVDTVNSIIKLVENNTVNSYVIPANANITLDGNPVKLSALTKDMSAAITKVNGVITSVAAKNNIQLIECILINVYSSRTNIAVNVKIGTENKLFIISSETAIYYNNQIIPIQNMPLNIPITIKLVNETVTEIRYK